MCLSKELVVTSDVVVIGSCYCVVVVIGSCYCCCCQLVVTMVVVDESVWGGEILDC